MLVVSYLVLQACISFQTIEFQTKWRTNCFWHKLFIRNPFALTRVREIPAKFPGHPRGSSESKSPHFRRLRPFRERSQTFWPPPFPHGRPCTPPNRIFLTRNATLLGWGEMGFFRLPETRVFPISGDIGPCKGRTDSQCRCSHG